MKGVFMQNKFTYLIIFLLLLFVHIGCSEHKTGQEYIHELGFFSKYDRETFRLYFDKLYTT
jgi:hypothetical protein